MSNELHQNLEIFIVTFILVSDLRGSIIAGTIMYNESASCIAYFTLCWFGGGVKDW